MPENVSEELSRIIEAIYRSESGRILAALVRLLGDLDVAEEAMHEAFAAALDTWTQADITAKPRPWLISTAGWARSSAAVLPDASALEFGC
jgi:RNA polymerase sigma-70 factor (ECF subfamily)